MSSVFAQSGDAGDISIDPNFLISNNSVILARADSGVGGDIEIVADNLILSPQSVINAEAGEAGVDGTVVTSSPEVDLIGGLIFLDDQFADASRLLRENCEAEGDLGGSTFATSGSPPLASGGGLLPGFRAAPLSAERGDFGPGDATILVVPYP